MNRMFRLVLCFVLSVVLAGCGEPPQKKKITLVFKMPTLAMASVTDPTIREAYDVFRRATADFAARYEEADVSFRLVKFDLSEETSHIQDAMGTDAAPDLLYEDFFNMDTYVHTGRVVPLDDIIDEAWRGDVNEAYWSMGRFDGRIYMLPYLARQNVLGYHRALFRKAGLGRYVNDGENIDSWTLEQWNEVLDTLIRKLPPHTYALAMYAHNEQSDTHTMTWIRSHGSAFFDDNGFFNLETPEGIAGLQWMRDNYVKGVYPPSCENLAARDCGRLFWNNQLAIKMINGPGADASDPDIGLVNFPSADGRGMATTFVTGFEVFDNGDPDRIKVAKAFLKFFYGTEKYLDYSTGNLPVSNRVIEKYGNQIYRLRAFRDNADHVVNFMDNNPNWRGVRSVFYKHIQNLFLGIQTPAEIAKALDESCNAAIRKGRQESTLHK